MAKLDIYEQVTNQIVNEIENGALPWIKEWISASGMPVNAFTGRQYSGINALILWLIADHKAFTSNRWCTFRQAKSNQFFVRKGEKSIPIVFYKTIEKETENDQSELKTIPIIKHFNVFNTDQIEGSEKTLPGISNNVLPDVESFILQSGVKIVPGSPSYLPGMDWIHMPKLCAFQSTDSYYATLFHELIHWTAAKSRLDRDLSGRFGDEAYAMEELIAEIGAAFLCAEFGFNSELRHAGYIGHWLKVMKADKKAIFSAAAKANQAVEYLKTLVLAEDSIH